MPIPGSTVELPPANLSLTEPYEVSSPDGTMVHRVSADTSNPDLTVIAAETSYPADVDWGRLWRTLDPTPDEYASRSGESELLSLTVAKESLGFDSIQRFSGVLHFLGYDWSGESVTENAVTTVQTTFTYPSAQTLNDRASQIFPSMPLTYASFEGGQFTAEDLLIPFAEAGEIIVPTLQPWQLHDHVNRHLLGLLAWGEDFVEPMQAAIKQWLVRNKAEAALPLPEVPGMNSEGVAKFLRPARAVLGHVVAKFDEHTVQIADALLIRPVKQYAPGIHEPRWEQVAYPIERFWTEGHHDARASNEVPRHVLGDYSYDQCLELAGTMWKRFEAAERNVLQRELTGQTREK